MLLWVVAVKLFSKLLYVVSAVVLKPVSLLFAEFENSCGNIYMHLRHKCPFSKGHTQKTFQ